MKEYLDKSTLIAELERKRDICEKVILDLRTKENKDYYQGKAEAYKETLDFLDDLEVKEVDLEKEIDFAMPSKYCWSGDGEAVYSKEQMCNFAKHFFELGLKAKNK